MSDWRHDGGLLTDRATRYAGLEIVSLYSVFVRRLWVHWAMLTVAYTAVIFYNSSSPPRGCPLLWLRPRQL